MRKVLILAAALALSAGPALAQQQQSIAQPEQQAAVVAEKPAPAAQQAEAPAKPTLYVSNDEIRRQVQAAEEARADKKQIGSQSWWYLVAAIAVGVIIAALVL